MTLIIKKNMHVDSDVIMRYQLKTLNIYIYTILAKLQVKYGFSVQNDILELLIDTMCCINIEGFHVRQIKVCSYQEQCGSSLKASFCFI
jgi:hypothetical protein